MRLIFPKADFFSKADYTPQEFRCWDHGCHGRKFICAANLKRHIKEKSNPRAFTCDNCGKAWPRKSRSNNHRCQLSDIAS
ncbi:hypothetical protein F5B19DRAFT_481058 [Rostrohypoxylon terebratum]|nr:hypothetical protein F5B19DRAFT_481058 [Rostrohypoxylon terebratum]